MMSLSWLPGLPALALLGLLGSVLKRPPRPLWRVTLIADCVLAMVYLAWAAWKTLSII